MNSELLSETWRGWLDVTHWTLRELHDAGQTTNVHIRQGHAYIPYEVTINATH